MTNCNENRINILQKNQKGNILIMVILVMLTASMLGLLSMSFLKEMFSYTINLDGYYKSYYLSKAGIELALTEIDNSTVGFSNIITGDDNIFTQNLCPGQDCSVTMITVGRSGFISEEYRNTNDCNSGNAFVLQPEESFPLPLFYQKDAGLNGSILVGNASGYLMYFNKKDLSSIKLNTINSDKTAAKINMQLIVPQDQQNYLYITDSSLLIEAISTYARHFSGDLDLPQDSGMYLMISNPNNYPISFCLSSNEVQLPATKYFVRSLGNYQGKYVGMQAIFAQPVFQGSI